METEKRAAQKVWGICPAGWTHAQDFQIGTKEFFESVIKKRASRELPFLSDILNEYKFEGMKVLEIGFGSGYDAYEFCRRSARVYGIDITPSLPKIAKRHLGYYGYDPALINADAEAVPFKDNSFDFIYSFGVLHHTPNINKALSEAYRVCKKGGKGMIAVYNKNSIFYWCTLYLYDYLFRLRFRNYTMKQRLQTVEYSLSDEKPLVNVYSMKQFKLLLNNIGFIVEKVLIRKLEPEDLPPIPLIKGLGRYIPKNIFNILGKRWGWYLIGMIKKE